MDHKDPVGRLRAIRFRTVGFPLSSMIAAQTIRDASLVESYEIELPSDYLSVVDVFLAIFGSKPL